MKTDLKLHLLILALLSLSGFAHAQGTAISYQGRLNRAGAPATGFHDFTFNVFDVEGGGTALATTVVLAAVPVTNGLFNVSLDFGPATFTGPARWLEIGVRTNGSAATAAYSILSPRQALTPTPYAIFATTSGTASNVANGSVVKSLNGLKDSVTLAAGANVTITPSGNTLTIASAGTGGTGPWSVSGNNAYYNVGNVGIGTATPARKLTVHTPNYGIEHTDGTVRLGTYLDPNGGWLGTVSDHPLNFFVNDGVVPRVTIDGDATSMASGPGFVSVGTPNGESGTSIKRGDNRADVRFDGSTLKLVAGPGFGPPSSLNGIAVSTSGNVGIGTTTPVAKLHAETSQPYTAAVYGNATGAGGVGVFGTGASGAAAFYADGNARQALEKGGFVKAMIYVDGDGRIVRCFNGINNTSSDGCGFVVTKPLGNVGVYRINFGFPVSDRFVSVTAEYRWRAFNGEYNVGANYKFFDSTSVEVFTFISNRSGDTQTSDFIIIMY